MSRANSVFPCNFISFKLSKNQLYHTIEPADTSLNNRTAIDYYLDLQVPDNRFFGDFVTIHTSKAKERPIDTSSGSSVYEGVTINYNRQNGKLDGFLEYEMPDFGINQIKQVVSQSMQYRIVERVTGLSNTGTSFTTTKTNSADWVLKAGLNSADLYAHQDRFFSALQNTDRRFLTWMPDKMEVVPGQDLFLSYLINISPLPTSIQLYCIVDETEVLIFSTKNPQFGRVLLCPIGHILNQYRGKEISFFLAANDIQRLSEIRTFNVAFQPGRYDRSLVFVNSLGGWDSINFTGLGTQKRKVDKKKARKDKLQNTGIDFVETVTITSDSSIELTLATGFFDKNARDIIQFLDELMLSEQIYLKTPKGYRYLELVDTELVQPQDDDDNLIGRQFTFRYLEEPAYSDASPGTNVSVRPTSWRGIDYVHILDSFGKRTGLMRPLRLQKIYSDTNTEFRPLTYKMNIQGTDGFIDDIRNTTITPGSTPFPSASINRQGTFIRSSCANGGTPSYATIIIPQGKYGGERAGDADVLAELEYTATNTQDYADLYGACLPNPWAYAWNVPTNFAHFRWNTFRKSGAYSDNYVYLRDTNEQNKKGNFWAVYAENPTGLHVYAPGTNDIDLPTNLPNPKPWLFGFYIGSGTGKVDIYINGLLYSSTSYRNPADGFFSVEVPYNAISSQAKVYILLT